VATILRELDPEASDMRRKKSWEGANISRKVLISAGILMVCMDYGMCVSQHVHLISCCVTSSRD
jgi:hypothetical protein